MRYVTLKADNGKYISAPGGLLPGDVRVDHDTPSELSTFRFIQLTNGKLAFETFFGEYLCAEGGGGGQVSANRNAIGEWELFQLASPGSGSIRYAIQTWDRTHYLTRDGDRLTATGTSIEAAQTFQVIDVNPSTPRRCHLFIKTLRAEETEDSGVDQLFYVGDKFVNGAKVASYRLPAGGGNDDVADGDGNRHHILLGDADLNVNDTVGFTFAFYDYDGGFWDPDDLLGEMRVDATYRAFDHLDVTWTPGRFARRLPDLERTTEFEFRTGSSLYRGYFQCKVW